MGCVYLARCKVNGKLYVGKTTRNFESYKHGYETAAVSDKPTTRTFIKALRKYGFDAFEWTILAEDDDNEWLCLMEQKWIKRLGTKVPNGYNHTDGGEGNIGWNPSDETRQKMREAGKRQFSVEGARERNSESTKRYFREHPEARERIGLQFRGKKRNPEAVGRMVKTITGRKRSEEDKRKISLGHIGIRHSEETKKKISEMAKKQVNRSKPPSAKGLKRSEETKRRMSEAQKQWNKWRDWESCAA